MRSCIRGWPARIEGIVDAPRCTRKFSYGFSPWHSEDIHLGVFLFALNTALSGLSVTFTPSNHVCHASVSRQCKIRWRRKGPGRRINTAIRVYKEKRSKGGVS
jgi:hypothetical protein